MPTNFDEIIDRRDTDCAKWRAFDPDVLPLWVADMDFRAPEPVVEALRCRVDHGVFGYGIEPPDLRPLIQERLLRLYGWQVAAEALVFVPGVVVGFNLAVHAATEPGDGMLAQTPVYYPILWAPGNTRCTLEVSQLARRPDGRYEIDLDEFEAAITPRTRILVLCNPHNPVGRVFTRQELAALAEVCARHDLVICSDEIHCDLVFPGHQHTPIATLDPTVEARTITLMAPSKTYNVAGLHASVAIIPDPELRRRFVTAQQGIVPHLDIMGYAAMLAAYGEGDSWLAEVLGYLKANRDYMLDAVASDLPGLSMVCPEGTYLAWLDCRSADLPALDGKPAGDRPAEWFLAKARVGLNEGSKFGPGGEGFVRLNFGCPRATLVEAVARMRAALTT